MLTVEIYDLRGLSNLNDSMFFSLCETEACRVGCLCKELQHSSHSHWVPDLPYYVRFHGRNPSEAALLVLA